MLDVSHINFHDIGAFGQEGTETGPSGAISFFAQGPQQRRIFAYAEFRLSVGNGAEQKGRLLRDRQGDGRDSVLSLACRESCEHTKSMSL